VVEGVRVMTARPDNEKHKEPDVIADALRGLPTDPESGTPTTNLLRRFLAHIQFRNIRCMAH